jgi:hypothetical protein
VLADEKAISSVLDKLEPGQPFHAAGGYFANAGLAQHQRDRQVAPGPAACTTIYVVQRQGSNAIVDGIARKTCFMG